MPMPVKSNTGVQRPTSTLIWIKPIAKEIKRVLASNGSFILNLGDVTVDGQTHLFTFDLPGMFVRELGYAFIDAYIWHKKSPPPGRYPNRFKDAWEYSFTTSPTPKTLSSAHYLLPSPANQKR
jgi:site-specific DNA-methyltransferase (adenine-specific)